MCQKQQTTQDNIITFFPNSIVPFHSLAIPKCIQFIITLLLSFILSCFFSSTQEIRTIQSTTPLQSTFYMYAMQ